MKVLIAGAGIGGLALAAALRRAGVEARVFERAPEFRAVGAGISVQTNAILALRSIGIGAEVVAAGAVPQESALLDARGRVLSRLSLAPLYRALGAPLVCLHRARLHDILLRYAGRGRVIGGRQVMGFRQDQRTVALQTEEGEEEGDLLVGADGMSSGVRAQLLGDQAPRYAGYTSWRAICRGVEVPRDRVTESWGRGARFGVVPIGDGLVYWYATANAPAGERAEAGERAGLRARFADWHEPVGDLIEGTSEEQLLRTDISDRPPVSSWSQGRVTLLGDAAHPMTPNLGQGGCQAIEDAVVLARALAEQREVPAALAAYERRRLARANRIVEQSRKVGELGQWQNALGCAARNLMLRLVPEKTLLKRMIEVSRFQP
jgi:2-polyprenyl-6-methoxyphenol hydroxylase-like FAD-dependent oxidoreductase